MAATIHRDGASDYYEFLGINEDATDKEIESAFREMVHRYHPDTEDGDAELFQQAGRARDTLKDEEERQQYDDMGHVEYVKEVYNEQVTESQRYQDQTDVSTEPSETETDTTTEKPVTDEPAQEGISSHQDVDLPGDSNSSVYDWQTDIRYEINTNAPQSVWDRFRGSWGNRVGALSLFVVLSTLGWILNAVAEGDPLSEIYLQDPSSLATLFIGLHVIAGVLVTLYTGYMNMSDLSVGSPIPKPLGAKKVIGGYILAALTVGLILAGQGASEHPLTAGWSMTQLEYPGDVWLNGSGEVIAAVNIGAASLLLVSLIGSLTLLIRSASATLWNDRFIRARFLIVPVWEVPLVVAGVTGFGGVVFGPTAATWLPANLPMVASLFPYVDGSPTWLTVSGMSMLFLAVYLPLCVLRASGARQRDIESLRPG